MHANQFKYRRILEVLDSLGVEFIVIGGVCAVAHGAPITTFDLDVVHRRTEDNIGRILAALAQMDAYHREPGSRRLPPQRAALQSTGPCLFTTQYGSLDFIGELSGKGYDELLGRTLTLPLGGGLDIRLLDLETLIQVKTEANRPKDLLVLPILRETLAQRRHP